jgi:calcineurin-like phosphoesterase family protein
MERERLRLLDPIPGRKYLILGNHDRFGGFVYLQHFERLFGMAKKYGMWLTHAPLHPMELRGKPNVHGHCHVEQIDDPRYLNVALEYLPDFKPLTLEEIRGWLCCQGAADASR